MQIVIPGEPKAVQSFRFTRKGIRYQPDEVKQWKAFVKLCAMQEIAKYPGFTPIEDGLSIMAIFKFSPPKSMRKAQREAIANGYEIYKTTRPDLGDNLIKGTCDALTGIIWKDDSLICRVASRKVYSQTPGITLIIEPVSKTAKIKTDEELPFY